MAETAKQIKKHPKPLLFDNINLFLKALLIVIIAIDLNEPLYLIVMSAALLNVISSLICIFKKVEEYSKSFVEILVIVLSIICMVTGYLLPGVINTIALLCVVPPILFLTVMNVINIVNDKKK